MRCRVRNSRMKNDCRLLTQMEWTITLCLYGSAVYRHVTASELQYLDWGFYVQTSWKLNRLTTHELSIRQLDAREAAFSHDEKRRQQHICTDAAAAATSRILVIRWWCRWMQMTRALGQEITSTQSSGAAKARILSVTICCVSLLYDMLSNKSRRNQSIGVRALKCRVVMRETEVG